MFTSSVSIYNVIKNNYTFKFCVIQRLTAFAKMSYTVNVFIMNYYVTMITVSLHMYIWAMKPLSRFKGYKDTNLFT